MNNKGSITDMFLFMAIGFILLMFIGIFLFFSSTVTSFMGQLDDNIGGGQTIGNISNQTLGVENAQVQASAKWIPVAFFFGMVLFIFISGFLVRVSPFFFILYIFIVMIAVIVSVPISNFYTDKILTDSTLGATYQQFTGANFIMQYLPIWLAVVGIFGTVFLVISYRTSLQGGTYR